ncbi:hypothetical protein LWI29_004865 [Acer saccharum]|uniref:DNA replication complex GINS protein PSF2 N-terminal domain-containing protein n=1 Tax=Acer saccharum TaxID=4024 RepID=A0AA39SMC1_ACESA|nr:hypothetical protein LWI29_004865 [Acer saccharum]
MAGQSDPHISLFSPQEIEFMAEDELVEIVPNIRMDPLNFISGDFGPFFPQIPAKVPLWLAVALKKRGKCTIRPPQWMSIVELASLTSSIQLTRNFENFEIPCKSGSLNISHLSAMEVNVVRPFVVRSLQAFYKHDNPVVMADLDSASDRQPQVRQPQVPRNAQRQPLKRR